MPKSIERIFAPGATSSVSPLRSILASFVCAVLLLACAMPAFSANVRGPTQFCGPNPCRPSAVPIEAMHERLARRQLGPRSTAAPMGASTSGITLLGEIAGSWDQVDGYVTMTYDFSADYPDIGALQVLLRGFATEREAGSNRYRANWDRSIYWLDFDGDGPAIPRLLAALELYRDYQPQPVGDPIPEFAEDPVVIAQCTATTPCTVNYSPYVLLREPGIDYSTYPDEAADADLLFVANAEGYAIAALLDVYDANEEYDFSKELEADDELLLSSIGYKISEPGFVYIIGYMDFVTLDFDLVIELANHIPGTDFPDPDLPPNLNAAQRTMKFLLDASVENGGNPQFAFAGPFNLGFSWGEAPDFLHRGDFEALAPDSSSQRVVKARAD